MEKQKKDWGVEFMQRYAERLGVQADCICHRCIEENQIKAPGMGDLFNLDSVMMILCPLCGNKRCPKASDHRLACTGSNEVGQPGSVYE